MTTAPKPPQIYKGKPLSNVETLGAEAGLVRLYKLAAFILAIHDDTVVPRLRAEKVDKKRVAPKKSGNLVGQKNK